MGEKIFSLKGSFFSAQNWFYPISERFGAFLAIFQIFHFLKIFRVFWSEKWAKKIFLEKGHFLVPKIGFTQFLNDLGHFRQFFKFFIFWKFSEFFGLKNRRKKNSRKMSLFSAQNWVFPISERFGSFLAIFKIRALFGTF